MSQMLAAKYDGIAGLQSRTPVGAVLTVGTKGPKGNPVDRDMFYFKLPTMNEAKERPMHPAFARYHALQKGDRSIILGTLVHETRAELAETYLRMHKPPKDVKWPATPHGEPVCTGDGKTATRWKGEPKGFEQMPCPNNLCEFRQGATKSCKPFARLLFMPRWKEGSSLPAPLTKLVTQSWNSAANLAGMLDSVEQIAASLGINSPSFFGLPIMIVLSEKSNPAAGQKFPVLSFSVDGNIAEFFRHQYQRRLDIRQLAGSAPLAALTDDSEQDPCVVAADVDNITPGDYAPRTTAAPKLAAAEPDTDREDDIALGLWEACTELGLLQNTSASAVLAALTKDTVAAETVERFFVNRGKDPEKHARAIACLADTAAKAKDLLQITKDERAQ